MKKTLLFFFSLLFVTSFAQVRTSTIFDFSKPTTLRPSITPSEVNGGAVDFKDRTFTSDDISLSFSITGLTSGVYLKTFYSNLQQKNLYSLNVSHSVTIDYKCSNNAVIEKIEFLDNSTLGGIAVAEGQHGSIDHNTKTWNADTNKLKGTLTLWNKSQDPATIYKMKVYYILPSERLEPELSLNTSSELESFSTLRLTFDRDVTYNSSKIISVKFNDNTKSLKTPTVSGKVATLQTNETINGDGDLIIHIPAGTFVASDGFCNKELTYTIKLKQKRDILKVASYSPANNSRVISLVSEKISITFDDYISDFDSNLTFGLYKEGRDRAVCQVKPIKDGKTIAFKFVDFDSEIKDAGTYSINIPAKTFYNQKGTADEIWNSEISLKYEIGDGAVMEPSVDPANGSEMKEFSSFKLTFANDVTYGSENENLTVAFKGNKVNRTVKTEGKVVTITLAEKINTDGEIKVHIPASCFTSPDGLSNKALDYSFTIKTDISKLKQSAQALLNQAGVGYPKSTSTAAQALSSVIAKASATEAEINSAIANLYAETDVVLPTDNQWYAISFVNTNGKVMYIGYNEEKITIVSDKANASAFLATNEDGKVVFKTADGNYLHVLTAYNAYYPTTSTSCVNKTKTDVNKLTLSRIKVPGKEKETFGLLSMYGLLGKSEVKGDIYTYSVLNFESGAFVNDQLDEPFFTDRLSSSIRIEAAQKPETYVDLATPVVSCSLDAKSYTLSITFKSEDNVVVYSSSPKVTVQGTGGNKEYDLKSGSNGQFLITLGAINPGSYSLIIPKKTLTSTVNGETRFNKAMTIAFDVKDALDPSVGFTEEFQGFVYMLNSFSPTESFACEQLNDYIFYINKGAKLTSSKFESLFNDTIKQPTQIVFGEQRYNIIDCYAPGDLVPSSKTVRLENTITHQVVRTGKLVRYNAGSDKIALRVVFDNGPIVKGELPSDTYTFVFESGTYGDANFGKYINDPSSISPSKCNVNPRLIHTIYVDNERIDLSVDATCQQSDTQATAILTFNKDNNVTLSNSPGKSVLQNQRGEKVKDVEIKATSSTGVFSIDLAGIPAGNYEIVIPQQTFNSTANGSSRYNTEMTISITVKNIFETELGFNQNYSANLLTEYANGKTYPCVAINEFGFWSSSDISAASSKPVTLVKDGKVIRTGKLVAFNSGDTNKKAVKIQFNEGAIKSKELASGTYKIVVDAITYGNSEFGKYLKNIDSVKPTNCSVNARQEFTIVVDNDNADVKVPSVSVNQSDKSKSITITFDKADNVDLISNPTELTLKTATGAYVKKVNIKKSNTAGSFVVEINGIEAGSYLLTLPANTFTSTTFGEKRFNKAINVEFETEDILNPSLGFKQEFTQVNQLLNITADKTYSCVVLNNWGLWSSNDIVASSKDIKLVYNNSVVRTGKLVEYNTGESKKALKIQFNNGDIKNAELADGNYTIVIEPATYGDSNFGKYLTDPASISPEQCVINPRQEFFICINNTYADIKEPSLILKQNVSRNNIFVKFDENDNIKMVNNTVTIKTKSGTTVKNEELLATNDAYLFRIDITSLDPREYTLVIPEKTVTSSSTEGAGRYNREFSIAFTIEDLLNTELGFVQSCTANLITEFASDKTYYCEDLNNFGFWSSEDLFVSNKDVKIAFENKVIMSGKLVAYDMSETTKKAYRIKFNDGEITPKSLANGEYTIIVDAATFGDANFGKYMDDVTSVAPSDCKINKASRYYVHVNNDVMEIKIPESTLDKNGNDILMTLTFNNSQNVSITGDSISVILNAIDGQKIKDVHLTSTETEGKFILNLGAIGSGSFVLTIPEKNLYCKDSSGIDRQNKEMNIAFEVSEALGVESIFINESNVGIIFDINGRKVSNMNRPGTYIVNGKKVLVK